MSAPVIVWFRQDLRLADNPALAAAATSGSPVLPVFVLDEKDPYAPGGASRWFLHGALETLDAALRRAGGNLTLRRGDAGEIIRQLSEETGAQAVYWNRCYEPHAVQRDTALKTNLAAIGVTARSFNAALLHEPWEIATRSGGPFKVYTPFAQACRARGGPAFPIPAPGSMQAVISVSGNALGDWHLRPSAPDWADEFQSHWTASEDGARALLEAFLPKAAAYGAERDQPARAATSRLSPHLHWGTIGPRQIWAALDFAEAAGASAGAFDKFRSELLWREFSAHLLFHFPQMTETNLHPSFDAFPWHEDRALLKAWQRGRTGIPIVDAGMRELWRTGTMHNRVRMIAASFLVKNAMVHWRHGAAWFWDTLVDADLASNTASWQWVAGCGADAAPFFRIFNPVLQGETHDPDGAYVKRHVPELAALPPSFVHRPWEAPAAVLRASNVDLGWNYPLPVLDLKSSRNAALAAYSALSKAA